jgi:ketosteroid isomerase-like protein
MKKLLLASVACVCVFALSSCSQSGNSDRVDQKTIDEVTELLTQYSVDWANAMKDKDASKVEDYFAPDFMYQEPSGERIYRDEFIKGFYENPNTLKTFEIIDVEVTLYGSNLANVTGGGGGIWVYPDGSEQVYESRFTNVWRKNSGKWQCIIGHGNPLQYGTPETDLSKIKAIPIKAAEALTSNNFEAWLDLLDEDVQVMFNEGKTLYGKEEVIQELRKYWVDMESDYSINHTEVKIFGDFAYGIGNVQGQEKNLKTGQLEIINSREMVIFRKQNNGEWKTFRLMVNQNK